MQLDLLAYPSSPGWRGDITSLEAADEMKGRAAVLRAMVVEQLRMAGERGLTADECAEILEEDKLNIRPRFSELYRDGKTEKTEMRRLNVSGKSARVYRIAGLPGGVHE